MEQGDGACLSAPGSREPDPQAVPALAGFDPSRWIGDKYSPNLRKWLLRQRRWMSPLVYRWGDGQRYVGWRDEDGWFSGARLMAVLTGIRGGSTVYAHVPSWSAGLVELSGFWSEYDRIGRCAIDPKHTTAFIGCETRWAVSGDYRECLWCGSHRQYHRRWTETVERDRWEPCDSDGSPQGGDSEAGSVHDSAGPEAIAQDTTGGSHG